MLIDGREYKSVWFEDGKLYLIDQRRLPFRFEVFVAETVDDVVFSIKDMVVRGAPAIGAAAAYGVALAKDGEEKEAIERLQATRPTAHDLFYALRYMEESMEEGVDVVSAAEKYAEGIIDKCRRIGEHGEKLISDGSRVLTHCNAGALATIDYGTALAPLRVAHREGKRVFVYADETRPRMQGSLTVWELKEEGMECVLIADNAAGYLMKRGEVDLVIVGADRIARNGDVANKIGTYEKAVVAKENNIPFYVAAPVSTFDLSIETGEEIVIEERSEVELKEKNGCRLLPEWVKVRNPAFDVTPARYITGYITEDGIKRSL
ncbi:MAG: S-methyl-5-thioribose-1-phosphate isomerase [Thermoplasmata archaeon]|nr:S-methyl-5-thioribose-1-phosphate isomerase [Thermoplasmata archaeon]